jgi:hypothetical protein
LEAKVGTETSAECADQRDEIISFGLSAQFCGITTAVFVCCSSPQWKIAVAANSPNAHELSLSTIRVHSRLKILISVYQRICGESAFAFSCQPA